VPTPLEAHPLYLKGGSHWPLWAVLQLSEVMKTLHTEMLVYAQGQNTRRHNMKGIIQINFAIF